MANWPADQIVEDPDQIVLGLSVVMPPPLPEELLDLRDVAAAEMYSTALS